MRVSIRQNLGFKILVFAKLRDWRVLEVNSSIPFSENLRCPSDDRSLRTLCTLVGNNGAQQIRLGCCCVCGYVGYIDRPTREWIREFYVDNWDKADSRDIKEEITRRKRQVESMGIEYAEKTRDRELDSFFARFPIDKNRPVLEIGCGYGTKLKYLQQRGFTRAVGIENSRHRARIAREAYGITTFESPFEDADTQHELKQLAPFQFIFSHHVLEHVYDPAEIIREAAKLQQPGGYLMLALPNVTGEPCMQTLLYVPHLHAFSKQSLAVLLNRHGYEIVDDTLTRNEELNVIARRVGTASHKEVHEADVFDRTVRKFIKGLRLEKKYIWPVRLLWWYRWLGADEGGQLPLLRPIFAKRRLKHFYFSMVDSWIKRTHGKPVPVQSCVITSLSSRYTSYEESPLEIQFDGNILLTYK